MEVTQPLGQDNRAAAAASVRRTRPSRTDFVSAPGWCSSSLSPYDADYLAWLLIANAGGLGSERQRNRSSLSILFSFLSLASLI